MKAKTIFFLILGIALAFAQISPEAMKSKIMLEYGCSVSGVCTTLVGDGISFGQYQQKAGPAEAQEKLRQFYDGCLKSEDTICEEVAVSGFEGVLRRDKLMIPICTEITSDCISNNFVEFGSEKETLWWVCGDKLNYVEVTAETTVHHTEPSGKQMTYKTIGEKSNITQYAEDYANLMDNEGLCALPAPEPVPEAVSEPEPEVVPEEPVPAQTIEEPVPAPEPEQKPCGSVAFILLAAIGAARLR